MATSHTGFPAARFGTKTVSDFAFDEQTQRDEIGGLVSLADGSTIDVAQIEFLAGELARNADVVLRDMPPGVSDLIRQIEAIQRSMQASGKFSVFHAIVKRKFAAIALIRPGTVGSFFYGCNVPVTDAPGGPSCSPLCAGSVQLPGVVAQCRSQVLLASYSGGSFTFTPLCRPEKPESEVALLYVNFPSLSSFPGFSHDEVSRLVSMGVTNVEMLFYSAESTTAVPVVTTNVSSLLRKSPLPSSSDASSGSTPLVLSVAVVVLVLAIVVIYRYRDTANRGARRR